MPAGISERRSVPGVVNLLILAGPLYMLQVYDRVLSSRSVPTLVALSVFDPCYGFQGALEVVRSRLVLRIARCSIFDSTSRCIFAVIGSQPERQRDRGASAVR